MSMLLKIFSPKIEFIQCIQFFIVFYAYSLCSFFFHLNMILSIVILWSFTLFCHLLFLRVSISPLPLLTTLHGGIFRWCLASLLWTISQSISGSLGDSHRPWVTSHSPLTCSWHAKASRLQDQIWYWFPSLYSDPLQDYKCGLHGHMRHGLWYLFFHGQCLSH